jgi:hypothetical protein
MSLLTELDAFYTEHQRCGAFGAPAGVLLLARGQRAPQRGGIVHMEVLLELRPTPSSRLALAILTRELLASDQTVELGFADTVGDHRGLHHAFDVLRDADQAPGAG